MQFIPGCRGMKYYANTVTAMTLSTEFFVLTIFIAGVPFFYSMLRDSGIGGWVYFFIAYIFLTFSNIFTVVEEIRYNTFFNLCEHSSIAFASIMLLVAVSKCMKKRNR